ncbi:MAG: Holliday junction branch migration protein RuvA [Planctomycetales bacterium]|nr:Holliday junction branch migration protein RuvA [Planctomycetales bacterium]
MYDYFKGTLTERAPKYAVVLVGGIGYRLEVPVSTFAKLPEPPAEVTILAHYHEREDGSSLFGFATALERDFFRLLISVHGIGPAKGIEVLSNAPVLDVARPIRDGDVPALRKVKGLGPKLAERLVVELRDKVGPLIEGEAPRPATPEGAAEADARRALVALGFALPEAEKAIARARKSLGRAAGTEELIRGALAAG